MSDIKPGTSFRTRGQLPGLAAVGRVTFQPEWSPSKPWGVFIRGTATCCSATLPAAIVEVTARCGYKIHVPQGAV